VDRGGSEYGVGDKGETGKRVAQEEGVCILEGGVTTRREGKAEVWWVDAGESRPRVASNSENDGSTSVFLGLFSLGQGTFEVL